MPKIPYKPEKSQDDDEDYEIVCFEDFCDKSPSSKTDLLTLNDNINYRLCYEKDKTAVLGKSEGESSSRDAERQTETSLSGPKNVTFKRKLSGSFAPFGRYNGKTAKGGLFSGVIPKPRNEGESGSREHRYERFSERRNVVQRAWERVPGLGSGMVGVALVCALCVAAWWAVGGAVGGAWGEEHYRKLWERAHPDDVKKPLSSVPSEKVLPEIRYHDHNNLSTKNKNSTEVIKKKEPNKKSYDLLPEQFQEACQQTPENMKFDCYPNTEVNEKLCAKRGCCWQESTTKGVPYCFYPPHYGTYRFVNMTENKHGMNVYYALARPSGYPGDFAVARMDFMYLSDTTLQIKIYDAEHNRFEVPIPETPKILDPIFQIQYRVQVDSSSVGFQIIRNSDNVTVINTQDIGGLILSDKFLQMSTVLPTDHVYGFGEHRARLMRDMNWNTLTMFNRDIPPTDNKNLYGTHPFYMAVENDGNTHGMLLLNSNAMDVVLQPTPAVTFRAIGGILNLFVFLGPTPGKVVAQYTDVVGRPFVPPYWSLGFHLCKYGYHNLNTTQHVWKTNREAGIPFDVQWNDIDYMETQNDFTIDKVNFAGLPEFVKQVHAAGMHYVVLFDPGVSAAEKPGTYPPFDRGLELSVFIKNSTDQPFVGKVWNPVSTVYPDFTNPNVTGYWLEMMRNFHKRVEFDGAWLDMNEPSNFLNGPINGRCRVPNLPYQPVWISDINEKTVCMDAKHYLGEHYDWHNLHALSEVITTHFVLSEIRNKRPFIISRATFPGMGRYAGHWTGDIASTWDEMRMTIPGILNFAIFGIPMSGADICGFREDTTVELCKRWMQLGAFYPFSRNHADLHSKPQDPVSLGPEVVAASVRALRLRYRLLPLYYTLFWRAYARGDTVITPLFFQSPENTKTHDIDDQFLIGTHVMVAPILEEKATRRKAFFPGPQKWYNILDGRFLCSEQWCDLSEDETVSVKGGTIIPLQEPPLLGPVSTSNSRSRPLQLLAAPDADRGALGDLYWDDGDSPHAYEEMKYTYIAFLLKDDELRSTVRWWGYGAPPINNITIFGQTNPVTSITINGQPCVKPICQFSYREQTEVLQIHDINISLDKPFSIKFTYKHAAAKKVSKSRLGLLNMVHNVSCKNEECSDED